MFYVYEFNCAYDAFLARSILNTYSLGKKRLDFVTFSEILVQNFELDFRCYENINEEDVYKYMADTNFVVFFSL